MVKIFYLKLLCFISPFYVLSLIGINIFTLWVSFINLETGFHNIVLSIANTLVRYFNLVLSLNDLMLRFDNNLTS